MVGKKKLEEHKKNRAGLKNDKPKGGKKKSGKKPIFVIQKHDARSLHYDFRLEVDGVLVSWAVPKGPSVNPKERRLAIHVDDHELDYADFEGVIPEGEYGAGTVMVWDYGTYENTHEREGKLISMGASLKDGSIKIWLDGKKLKGGYKLVRVRESQEETGDQWLLIKMKDEMADDHRNPISTQPDSAKTGRSLEEIAESGE
jgi:DNA ligase D-like protein (predicted 3'-phosphoesterase)